MKLFVLLAVAIDGDTIVTVPDSAWDSMEACYAGAVDVHGEGVWRNWQDRGFACINPSKQWMEANQEALLEAMKK